MAGGHSTGLSSTSPPPQGTPVVVLALVVDGPVVVDECGEVVVVVEDVVVEPDGEVVVELDGFCSGSREGCGEPPDPEKVPPIVVPAPDGDDPPTILATGCPAASSTMVITPIDTTKTMTDARPTLRQLTDRRPPSRSSSRQDWGLREMRGVSGPVRRRCAGPPWSAGASVSRPRSHRGQHAHECRTDKGPGQAEERRQDRSGDGRERVATTWIMLSWIRRSESVMPGGWFVARPSARWAENLRGTHPSGRADYGQVGASR